MKKVVFLFLFTLLLTGCTNLNTRYEAAYSHAIENYDKVYKVTCISPAYFNGSEKYDIENDKKGVCYMFVNNNGTEELHFYGNEHNTKKVEWDPYYTYEELEDFVNSFSFRYHEYRYTYSYTSDQIFLKIDIKSNNDLFINLDGDEPIYYEVDFKKTEEMNSIYTYYKEVDLDRFLRNLRP